MRRVLVTGSTRGIGKSIALSLLDCGFEVVFHGKAPSSHAEETLHNARQKFDQSKILFFDITDRALAKELLEAEITQAGAFYGVVLSAGVNVDRPFPGMQDEDWDRVIRTDLDGFYNVLRPLILPMIQLRHGGRIVTISSLSAIAGNRGQVNYSAAKAGLIGASKSLAREVAKRRITVNCIAPGGVDTDMIPEQLRAEMIEAIPMGRLGRPEEVAGAVRYLFSEEAEYMTGQVLVLSGGLL